MTTPTPTPGTSDVAVRLSTILSVYVMRDCSGLPADTNLVSDLGLDSLDLAQIAITIEDEFEMEIRDDKIMTLVTVGGLVNYVQRHERSNHAAVPTPVQEDADDRSDT